MGFERLIEDDDDSPVGVSLTEEGKGCSCCCCFVLILILILCLASVDTVEPLEYGLHYSTWSKSISDPKVYDSGRYMLGLGHKFVRFPRNKQSLQFAVFPGSTYPPIRAKTGRGGQEANVTIEDHSTTQGGGLNVTLSVSLEYQFKKSGLLRLYQAFKNNYRTPFRLEFEETFRQVASRYTQFDYWQNLDTVLNDMEQNLRASADNLHIEFVSVQLLEVELDRRFEEALVRTQVEQERKKKAEFELHIESIRQEREVIIAEANATVRVINATAQADMTRFVQEAKANAQASLLGAQGAALNQVKDSLDLKTSQLLWYAWFNVLDAKENAKLFLGLKPESVIAHST